MENLRKAVKELMTSENLTEVEAISALQGAAVKMGNEKTLEALIEMKNEIIEKMFV